MTAALEHDHIEILPRTRALVDDLRAALERRGLVDPSLPFAGREADAVRLIMLAARVLPLRDRLASPLRTWRARIALRPYRAKIRAEAPFAPKDPWLSQDGTMRLILSRL